MEKKIGSNRINKDWKTLLDNENFKNLVVSARRQFTSRTHQLKFMVISLIHQNTGVLQSVNQQRLQFQKVYDEKEEQVQLCHTYMREFLEATREAIEFNKRPSLRRNSTDRTRITERLAEIEDEVIEYFDDLEHEQSEDSIVVGGGEVGPEASVGVGQDLHEEDSADIEERAEEV